MSSDRTCRRCGITDIQPGTMVDDEPLCWADEGLCSSCSDALQAALERDAARYRWLRERPAGKQSIDEGGVYAGRPGKGLVFLGEHLDRAIDEEMAKGTPAEPPLEERLADCLADILDTPLMTGRGIGDLAETGIGLGFFRPEIAERAADLLEEAGR